jgi:preprotein translocase subunit Sec61beta
MIDPRIALLILIAVVYLLIATIAQIKGNRDSNEW